MANKLKARLAAGKACVNAWLAIPSGFSAEVMAQCGWDSVTVDMQHGVQDYQSMVQCFQAMDRHPITPLVRVPWNEPGIIGKALDGGAWGIICPMVNNKAEAAALAVLRAVSAGRQAQQRPDPRRDVWRGVQLPEDRQRRSAGDPDDRDPGRHRQHRRDPVGARHQRHLCRPVRHGILARPGAEARSRGTADPRHLREAAGELQAARQVRRHPQRHRGIRGAHDRHGLSASSPSPTTAA